MLVIIAILAGLSLAGVAYTIARALYSGAETYTGTYSEHIARQFEDIFQFIPPKQIAQAGWAMGGLAFVVVFASIGSMNSLEGLLAGLLLGIIAGSIALQSPQLLLRFLKTRRLKRFNLQLVDTLMTMSNALKAGFSILQSFETAARDGENPIAQEFTLFLQETHVGVNFEDALRNMERRVGSDDLTLVVMAIETARKTGGNLTEIFEKIAHTIRERMRIEQRIRTMTAQGRLQGIVVGAMPIVIGVAMMILDPDMMMPFLYSPLGLGTIAAVIVLVATGAVIIRKIVNIDV
jgi:tight adherence protein B